MVDVAGSRSASVTTGVPMTYMANERQFIVVAIGARGFPAELVALALP